jgi:hypothetical protein
MEFKNQKCSWKNSSLLQNFLPRNKYILKLQANVKGMTMSFHLFWNNYQSTHNFKLLPSSYTLPGPGQCKRGHLGCSESWGLCGWISAGLHLLDTKGHLCVHVLLRAHPEIIKLTFNFWLYVRQFINHLIIKCKWTTLHKINNHK